MDHSRIESAAYAVLQSIWKEKEQLWPDRQPVPIQMLCPQAACRVLGLEYTECDSLGFQQFAFKGQQFRTAGLLDRQRRLVSVSAEDRIAVKRFTAAHEKVEEHIVRPHRKGKGSRHYIWLARAKR